MRNKNAKVSDPNSFHTCPGSPVRDIYEAVVSDTGAIEVKVTGQENIQDKIEAARSSTDMSYILKQLALGNNDVLVRSAGQYGDFTQMPKTMAEALQMQINAEKAFAQLPLDVRQKFNNDFHEWLVGASAMTPAWIEKMGIIQEVIKEDEEKGENNPE